jgi:hypothetical protein
MNINTGIKFLKGSREAAALFVRGDLTNPVTLNKFGNLMPRKIRAEDLKKDWTFVRFVPEKTPGHEKYECIRIERYVSDNLSNPYISYQLIEEGSINRL